MVVNLQCNLNCLGYAVIWNDINICKSLGIVFPFQEILQCIGFSFNYCKVSTSTFDSASESALFLSTYLLCVLLFDFNLNLKSVFSLNSFELYK